MLRRNFNVVLIIHAAALTLSLGCIQSAPTKTEPATEQLSAHHHSHAGAHGSDETGPAQLFIRSTPQNPIAGEPVRLDMMLHDSQGRMLKEFEINHEKLAHLILIRDGLDEFAHLHPFVDHNGNLRETHTFSKAGKYHVYLDYKPTGQHPRTSTSELTIGGDVEPAEALVADTTGLVRGSDVQANITTRDSKDGSRIVSFQLTNSNQEPMRDLEQYLGAMGHLVVVSANGMDYVHAHPLTASSVDGKVEFEVHFPRPGIYKLWGQFQRGGRVYTLPTILQIGEHPEAKKQTRRAGETVEGRDNPNYAVNAS
jgi:hypothetical protein